jgi:hypothetical protein
LVEAGTGVSEDMLPWAAAGEVLPIVPGGDYVLMMMLAACGFRVSGFSVFGPSGRAVDVVEACRIVCVCNRGRAIGSLFGGPVRLDEM